MHFAGGFVGIGQAGFQLLFATATIAGRQLNPLLAFTHFALELDDLNVARVFIILKDLGKLHDVLLWPFFTCTRLSVHVEVLVRAITAVSSLNVALLVLHYLMLVLLEPLVGVENGVVDGQRLPVAVVGSPRRIVALEPSGWWFWERSWIRRDVVRVVRFASSHHGVA